MRLVCFRFRRSCGPRGRAFYKCVRRFALYGARPVRCARKRLAAQKKPDDCKRNSGHHQQDRLPAPWDAKQGPDNNNPESERNHEHFFRHTGILRCFHNYNKFALLLIRVSLERVEQLFRRAYTHVFIQFGEFAVEAQAPLWSGFF